MLSSNSVTEAIAIVGAEGFSNRVALNPFPNSFLDTLVGLTKNQMAMQDSSTAVLSGEAYSCGRSLEEVARAGTSDGQHLLHTTLIDDQVDAITQVATRNIRLARTDAIPMIASVMEQLNQLVNPDIPYAYQKMEVFPMQYHPLWSSEWVQNVTKNFMNGYNTAPAARGIILSLEEEQYKNYLELTKTGLATVDGQLKQLLSAYNTEELDKLFASAFFEGYLPAPSETNDVRLEDLLLVHVWAERLLELPPERSSLGKGSYEAALSNVIAATGFRMWEITNKRGQFAAQERLIIRYAGDKKVVVNGDLYAGWLKAGGKPEMIMGAAVSNMSPKPFLVKDINVIGARLLTEWNSYVALTSKRDTESKLFMARGEFFKIIQRMIDERSDTGYLDSKDGAHDRLNSYMAALPSDFISDPYPFVRNAVIGIFYPESDILAFVSAMDDCCMKDKDISPDDAAVLATIEYLTSWICKFIIKTRR